MNRSVQDLLLKITAPPKPAPLLSHLNKHKNAAASIFCPVFFYLQRPLCLAVIDGWSDFTAQANDSKWLHCKLCFFHCFCDTIKEKNSQRAAAMLAFHTLFVFFTLYVRFRDYAMKSSSFLF